MASTHNIYGGGNYGLDSKYDEFLGTEYRTPAGNIGMTVDPRTANQIQMVSNMLSTGAKVIEVQMTMPEVAESIPNQHLEELNKLRKLTGSEFTVHGPLVEPTGVVKQGWDETHREQAERQMWSALERAKKVDPDGDVVVTFHSSNGLPEPFTKVIDENGNEKVTSMMVVDDRSGQFSPISPKENYLTGEKADAFSELKRANEEKWSKELSHTSYGALQGASNIQGLVNTKLDDELNSDIKNLPLADLYAMSKTKEGQEFIDKNTTPEQKIRVNGVINKISYGDIYVRESYNDLQTRFNEAWVALDNEKEKNPKAMADLKKLQQFQDEFKSKGLSGANLNDPKKLLELSQEVIRGVNVLTAIETPQIIRPMREWAIDKASDTFSNLALRSYKEFEKKGKPSPIISIENPPTGMGLNRAADLKDLIEESRDKFVKNAVKEFGLSESEAKEQADKVIGATWDLGHINMIRKYGYEEKHLIEETKTIKPYLKHVHLSDNFGMEHTELPMGMGNVPTKKHMEIIDEYNKKIKKIVETGGQWYQSFKTPPFGETLAALGSPLYSMQMGPVWNQAYGRMMGQSGSYFAGYGMNPDVHHSIYGAGFSGLPTELGGQIAGRSRLSGTAME